MNLKNETYLAIAEILGDGYKCYVNLETEEVHTAEKVKLEDQKSNAYAEFVPLESTLTFGIMKDYCATVEDFGKQSDLMECLMYEQPFQNFKRKVYAIRLADEWIAYRSNRISTILQEKE